MSRIVVADDDADILESNEDVLKLAGFAVTTVREARPDLLLQDVNMPGLDLERLVREVRADPSLRGVRVLPFTASESIQETAQRLGADGFIQKPFNSDRIQQTLERFLAKPPLGGPR
ncbi:MAG: response regulator [Halobacteriales archaeon]|nr:response regulator [Halobacteriales archaeon]